MKTRQLQYMKTIRGQNNFVFDEVGVVVDQLSGRGVSAVRSHRPIRYI